MPNVVFDGQIEGVQTRADRSNKVTIGTQEMGAEEMARLFALNRLAVKVLVSSENIAEEQKQAFIDAPIDSTRVKGKTPSKRLRDVLFVLWKQAGSEGVSAEQFYEQKMEQIIQMVKNKLE